MSSYIKVWVPFQKLLIPKNHIVTKRNMKNIQLCPIHITSCSRRPWLIKEWCPRNLERIYLFISKKELCFYVTLYLCQETGSKMLIYRNSMKPDQPWYWGGYDRCLLYTRINLSSWIMEKQARRATRCLDVGVAWFVIMEGCQRKLSKIR